MAVTGIADTIADGGKGARAYDTTVLDGWEATIVCGTAGCNRICGWLGVLLISGVVAMVWVAYRVLLLGKVLMRGAGAAAWAAAACAAAAAAASCCAFRLSSA